MTMSFASPMMHISKLTFQWDEYVSIPDSARGYRAGKADHFLERMDSVHEYIRGIGSCRPVKIAIIDTGVHFDARVRNSYCSRLKECRSWLQSTFDTHGTAHPEGTDPDGHGTHCTSTVLKCAPEECEVYVAQVFAARAESSLAFGCPRGTNTRVAQVRRTRKDFVPCSPSKH
jgi:hypothetical protein